MTLSEIEFGSSLSSYFHPDELEVILSEIFYLPCFLRHGDICTVSDIAKYGFMEPSQILARMVKIFRQKPAFDESRGEELTIDLIDLLQHRAHLSSRILEFKSSEKSYCLTAPSRMQAFSAAMYLIEEGIKVKSYAVKAD